ncbi:MAG: lipocalin-like domain-containing protein [Candidatus Korobacteraceae bacterium]
MRLNSVPRMIAVCLSTLALMSIPTVAQQAATESSGQSAGSGAPAALPHDMSSYMCSHYDGPVCDVAPAPPPDYHPLVGTWVRFSLLRNSFSVQPPSAPLYVKFNSDGYFSMMEFPANRPKVNKPLAQQTAKELLSRFENMGGAWGNYTLDGQWSYRHQLRQFNPASQPNSQLRGWSFEGNIFLMDGTGPTRSPQARFRKLPNQPLGSRELVGSWERTAISINGSAVSQSEPEYLLLGEDGWFSQTLLPTGRKPVRGKEMNQWSTQEFVDAYQGLSASRGTYNVYGTTFIRKHIADTDPNLEGRDETGQYKLQGDTMTVQGTNAAGQKFEATYRRLKPFDVFAPLAKKAGGE